MVLVKVFLDSAYVIALLSSTDKYHQQAEKLAEQMEMKETKLVTTQAIVLEIGNALAKMRYRRAAIELIDSFIEDPNIEIVSLSQRLWERAINRFQERPDKEWGLTDCISFIVMEDYGLTEALTTDNHFNQAGFQVLLSAS